MKAVVIRKYGGRDVLKMEDVPVPRIAVDDVLVRVRAVGVNPLDWKVRAGYLSEMLPYEFPLIPGWDVSGTVESVGSGVSQVKAGDEVFALADITRNGAYAEFIAVNGQGVAPKPATVDFIQAAAVPMAALTACQALLDTARLEKGQRVLIQAAAGGVGTFAVQLAKLRGAYVLGTASLRNRGFLLELGADEVVDYTAGPFEEAVREVDVVLESMGGEVQERSWQTLKEGGILVSLLGPPDRARAEKAGARGESVFVKPDAGQLAEIGDLIEKGHIKPVVTETLPLEEFVRAQEMSETHHVRGKIVLKVG